MEASVGVAAGPLVDVNAMAAIVRDLAAGGVGRLRDGGWLRERAVAAGLDRHEYASLEELRRHLRDHDEARPNDRSPGLWS